MNERNYDFFIKHCQASGQDQCAQLCMLLQQAGASVWHDMSAPDLTDHGMEVAVSQSHNMLMFLSDGLMGRPFINDVQRWATQYGCNFIGIFERDERHGKADFIQEMQCVQKISFIRQHRAGFSNLAAAILEMRFKLRCTRKSMNAVVAIMFSTVLVV